MSITVTTAQWTDLLQEDYVQQEIVSAVNKATPFKVKLKRKGMQGGKRRVYPVQVGLSQGQGARAESAAMPYYGAGEYKDVYVDSRYNYAPFRVTGQAMEFSNRAAFVEFGMRILTDTKEGFGVDIQRQCWGAGDGALALVNNAANYANGSTSIIVDSAYGQLWGSLATNTTFLLKRNMKVQFGTNDNAGAGYTITAVTGTTITLSSGIVSGPVLDNAVIYKLGSKDLEIEGWLKIVATSSFQTSVLGLANDTYHNIDRSDYPEWEGNIINAAAALSLTNIRALKDTVYKRGESDTANLCINSTEVTRDFEALLQPNTRFLPATKLEAGVTTLEHDGLRFTKDSKAPVKCFNIMDTTALAWAQTQDPHWLKDAAGIMRVVAGFDMLEGLLKWYSNLDCERPRDQGMAYNLTVT